MKHRLHHLPHYTQPIVSSFLKKSRVRIVPLFKDSSPQEASIYNYRSYFSSSVSTTTTSNDDASIPSSLTEKEKNLLSMSLLDAKAALEAGHTTSQELVASCLKQIQRTKDLNAYITTASRESLLDAAKQADDKRASHSPGIRPSFVFLWHKWFFKFHFSSFRFYFADVGVLEGIPIAVKDSFCTKDLPTTCASRMLKGDASSVIPLHTHTWRLRPVEKIMYSWTYSPWHGEREHTHYHIETQTDTHGERERERGVWLAHDCRL